MRIQRKLDARCNFVKLMAVGIAAVTVSGCMGVTALAGMAAMKGAHASQPPKVLSSSDQGITIRIFNPDQEQKAVDISSEHCKQFNRSAKVVTRTDNSKANDYRIAYSCEGQATIAAANLSSSNSPVTAPSKVTISRVQVELKARGFDPGSTDGSMGRKTRDALRRFQVASRLPVTGEIDAVTQKALAID